MDQAILLHTFLLSFEWLFFFSVLKVCCPKNLNHRVEHRHRHIAGKPVVQSAFADLTVLTTVWTNFGAGYQLND